MKKFLTFPIAFLGFLFFTTNINSQSNFDKSLQTISNDLAGKLSEKNKKNVVVLYVTDINKTFTIAGKYLADVISVHLINNNFGFQVFDRENLNSIAEAKKLMSEGYISVDAAKQIGKLLSVDAIVIGNYTILSNTMKLTLKALDSSTGYAISASIQDLPLDADAGALLGITVFVNSSSRNSNYGFNQPLNSKEQYNNPETVNKDCENLNSGDYCFCNKTTNNLILSLNADGVALRLSPNQTQCLYSLRAGSYRYHLMTTKDLGRGKAFIYRVPEEFIYVQDQGQFLIEKCKSKTFNIN